MGYGLNIYNADGDLVINEEGIMYAGKVTMNYFCGYRRLYPWVLLRDGDINIDCTHVIDYSVKGRADATNCHLAYLEGSGLGNISGHRIRAMAFGMEEQDDTALNIFTMAYNRVGAGATGPNNKIRDFDYWICPDLEKIIWVWSEDCGVSNRARLYWGCTDMAGASEFQPKGLVDSTSLGSAYIYSVSIQRKQDGNFSIFFTTLGTLAECETTFGSAGLACTVIDSSALTVLTAKECYPTAALHEPSKSFALNSCMDASRDVVYLINHSIPASLAGASDGASHGATSYYLYGVDATGVGYFNTYLGYSLGGHISDSMGFIASARLIVMPTCFEGDYNESWFAESSGHSTPADIRPKALGVVKTFGIFTETKSGGFSTLCVDQDPGRLTPPPYYKAIYVAKSTLSGICKIYFMRKTLVELTNVNIKDLFTAMLI